MIVRLALLAAGIGLLLASAAVAQDAPGQAARDELPVEGLEVRPGGLTAEHAAQRALANSYSVREKRAQLRAAQARISQTMIEFFPKLSLRASYTRVSPAETNLGSGALLGVANPGPVTIGPNPRDGTTTLLDSAGVPAFAAAFDFEFFEDNYALNANVTIPLSDYALRLADSAAAASSSKDAARLALDAEQRRVRIDAQVLYYQWLRAQSQLFIAKRAVERTRGRLEDARAALAVGRLSNADVLRFEAQVAKTELALTQVDALRALTEAQLAIVMQDPTGTVYAVGQAVPRLEAPASLDRKDTPRLLSEALANRLELKAVDASTRALDRARDAVEAGAWPRVSAVGEASYANPNPRYFPQVQEWKATWSVGVAATFSVDDPFAASARSDELGANAEAARSQRRALENAITSEVVSAQLQLVKARASIAALETALRAAEESYRVTSELFRVGRATPTDVIDAESDLFGAKAQLADARIESVIAVLQFRHALGRAPAATTGAR